MKNRTKVIIGGAVAGTLMAGAAAGIGTVMAVRHGLRRLREHRLRELRGQTVLITGGSRGLGLALAEEFAQFGAKVAICARDEQELARARQQLEDLGAVVCAVPCDVSKPEEVDNLISSVARHMGGIDVLVNNAGVISVGPILSQELKDFQEAMDVMFWGTVHPTLAVLPQMLARGTGRIVNISSIGGKVSVPHLIPYGCAKFAVTGFSEGLHAELKRFGNQRTYRHSRTHANGVSPERAIQRQTRSGVRLVCRKRNESAGIHFREPRGGKNCERDLRQPRRADHQLAGEAAGGTSRHCAGTDARSAGAGEPAIAGCRRKYGEEGGTRKPVGGDTITVNSAGQARGASLQPGGETGLENKVSRRFTLINADQEKLAANFAKERELTSGIVCVFAY